MLYMNCRYEHTSGQTDRPLYAALFDYDEESIICCLLASGMMLVLQLNNLGKLLKSYPSSPSFPTDWYSSGCCIKTRLKQENHWYHRWRRCRQKARVLIVIGCVWWIPELQNQDQRTP